MKKWLIMVLAAVLLIGMAGCAQKKDEGNMEGKLLGGWEKPESSEITDEVRAIFEKAREGLTGVDYEPISLVGTQVVAGRNYCILCRSTYDHADGKPRDALIYIYVDLEGNAKITDIVNLEEEGDGEQYETTQIGNPFVDYETLMEAAEAAGFEMTAPEAVEGYDGKVIQAIEGELAQVIFTKGDDRLFLRKGKGDGDISGDYNEYGTVKKISVGGHEVTLKGDEDTYRTAVWSYGGYAYAIMADDSLPEKMITSLVMQMQ